MTTVTAFRGGRALFVLLWLVGLGVIAAVAAGVIPGGIILAAGVLLALCVTIAIGVMSQRSGFFARPLIRVEGVSDRLALTFDDGPDPEFTPRLLELLRQAGQRATFFVIGSRVAQHPALARRIVMEGHELGNHTLDHRWHMGLWSARRIARELRRTSELIESHTGRRPALVRPPAAMLSPRIEAGCRAAGLRLVGFSTRSLDGSPAIPARQVLARLLRGLAPGAILVLHDAAVAGKPPHSIEVLPRLCEEMAARGLRSVPLSELLEG